MRILTTMVLLLVINTTFGQFTSIFQSITNTFNFAKISEADNVALIGGARVAKSTDSGFNWTELNLGIYGMPSSLYEYQHAAIVSPTTYCLSGDDYINNRSIIIRTTDGGNTWSQVFQTAIGSNDLIKDIESHGNTVMAIVDDVFYRSTDGGLTWGTVTFAANGALKIDYDESTNEWIAIRAYYLCKSADDGITWTQTFVGGISALNRDISYRNGQTTIARSSTGNFAAQYYVLNSSSLPPVNDIVFNGVATSGYAMASGRLLPDGSLFSHSYATLTYTDTTTDQIYYYNHALEQPSGGAGSGLYSHNNDFEFDQTYGLLVGDFGAVSRYGLTAPENQLYVPAGFSLVNSSCPADSLKGYPDFTYGDSSKWYYDGNLVSTDDTLNFLTPYQFGSHEVVHHVWYNGNLDGDTNSVYYYPLNLPPSYTLSYIDSIPCYQSGGYFGLVSNSTNASNTALEYWLNDVMFDSISPAPSSNTGSFTPIISTQDTLYIISKREQFCGTSVDTISAILYPGIDLTSVISVSNIDSAYCILDTMFVHIDNTNFNYQYTLHYWSDQLNSYNVDNYGNGGTIEVPILAMVHPGNVPPISNNYYFEIEVEDLSENCSSGFISVDTAIVVNPQVTYYMNSTNYFLDDTLTLTNINYMPATLWSVNPAGLAIMNPTDSVPTIVTDVSGEYELTLLNTPFAGCQDSMIMKFNVGDTMPEMDLNICDVVESSPKEHLVDIEIDPFGNIYEVGTVDIQNGNGVAYGFYLAKRDANSQLLWEKTAPYGLYSSLYLLTIKAIDIDEYGDVYAIIEFGGATNIQVDSIDYPGNHSCYLVKYDGTTGIMQWARAVNEYSLNSVVIDLTDILVTDDKIYLTAFDQQFGALIVTDLDGYNIDYQGMVFSSAPINAYYQSYSGLMTEFSMRAEEMYSGEILVIANQFGSTEYNGNIVSDPLAQNKYNTLIFKYKEGLGLYDFKNVGMGMPDDEFDFKTLYQQVAIDPEDNIYIAIGGEEEVADSIIVMDSTISNSGVTIFKMDKNYNLQWMRKGGNATIEGLRYAENTGELIIGGRTKDNFSFESNGTNFVSGSVNPIIDLSTNKEGDVFLLKVDTLGNSLGMKFFKFSAPPFWSRTSAMNVTPCGDIYLGVSNNFAPKSYTELYSGYTDSLMNSQLILLKDSCITSSCTFLYVPTDTIVVCNTADSVWVDLGGNQFMVDSVNYSLYSNGAIVESGVNSVLNNGFYVSLPNPGSPYQITIGSPNISNDTIYIQYHTPMPSSFSFDSDMCYGEEQLIIATPATSTVTWSAGNYVGDTLNYTSVLYNVGNNEIYTSAADSLGCLTFDTLSVHVVEPLVQQFNSPYYLECDSTLSIPYSTTDFINAQWLLNGSNSANLFSNLNLNNGLNYVTATLTDTNICYSEYDLIIDYCNLSINEVDGFTITLLPIPNNGSFEMIFSALVVNGICEIYSSEGRKVFEQNFMHSDKLDINLDLSSGVYYLYLLVDGRRITQKLLVR